MKVPEMSVNERICEAVSNAFDPVLEDGKRSPYERLANHLQVQAQNAFGDGDQDGAGFLQLKALTEALLYVGDTLECFADFRRGVRE